MKLKIVTGALLFAWCLNAQAFVNLFEDTLASVGGWYSADELYSKGPRSALLVGYIAATADSQLTASEHVEKICIPQGVNLGQLSDVVYKYMQDNPATRHLNGIYIVRKAIRSAWPCPPK